MHRFNELLDIIDCPINTNGYQAEQRQKPVVPTQSVVETHTDPTFNFLSVMEECKLKVTAKMLT